MQSEHFVNANHRATRARGRTGNAGWLREVEQAPEPEQTQEVVGLGEILRGEVELTTRTQGGSPAVIRIPHSLLAILVTIAITVLGAGYWLVSTLTEMRTNLVTIQQNQRDQRAMQSSNLKLMTAYATNETNRIQFVAGLLTKAQQEALNNYDRAHPRPQLPNTDDADDKEQ